MIERTVHCAKAATANMQNIEIYVATDDERISGYCGDNNIDYVLTSAHCKSGTDRVAQAVETLQSDADFIINLQGDAPLTPPRFIRALIEAYGQDPCDVVTPVQQLSWDALDNLREAKQTTPFSGTCAVFNHQSKRAYWFSKNIIPAVRKEDALRSDSPLSPVYQHVGLYGYSPEMLSRYSEMEESLYEQLEGLEQLRLLENQFVIRCVPVEHQYYVNSGVDSAEDVKRAESYIIHNGDPMKETHMADA